MTTISTALQAVSAIWLHPAAVFTELKQRKHWSWLPFLLVMMLPALVGALYFDRVDWSWYQQNFVLPALQGLTPADKEIALEFSSRATYLWSSLSSVLIGGILVAACYGFYLSKMTQLDEENIQGFGDWFGLCWWTFLPTLVASAIGLLLLLIGDNQQSPNMVLAPLSIANLLQLSTEQPWFNLASSVSLTTLWTALLQYKGVRAWTTLKPLISWVIVLTPYVVLFGIWAALV
ncbi:YIP1 family protein [uncultured Ferrimonas sp.]|uniref:YIP1 family protein n=1 Tax=uncultured Ferrimonas sp. TaxID=432640 RepID=UPI00260C8FEB|nr:YIP1 family protein [uncultured Ferrimonas sp.]